MRKTITTVWPLFFGLALIAISTGVQNSLLGIRADLEGFDTAFTGLIMSGYFIGFLFGSTQGPRIIQQVGHVRTFGALTALASITVLLHALFVHPWLWFLLRLLTGLAISGLYVVAESWLNQAATDRNRGQILSFYMIIMLLGMFAGQFLLNLADPSSFELFGTISVLMSFAAIPILITVIPTPTIEPSSSIGIRKLLGWAPYGLPGAFLVNMCFGMIFGMAAVYASKIQLSTREISWFMAAILFGGLVLQWPLGRLSDKLDRRIVIVGASAAAGLFALLAATRGQETLGQLLLYVALLGGFLLPLYALFVALVNDYMRPEKIVAASGTVLLVGGLGAAIGPLLIAWVMDVFGTNGFFWFIGAVCGCVAALGLVRIIFFPYVPEEDRHEFSIYAPATVGTVLHAEQPETSDTKAKEQTLEAPFE